MLHPPLKEIIDSIGQFLKCWAMDKRESCTERELTEAVKDSLAEEIYLVSER